MDQLQIIGLSNYAFDLGGCRIGSKGAKYLSKFNNTMLIKILLCI